MQIRSFVSNRGTACGWLIAALVWLGTVCVAQNNTLSGTYTFVLGVRNPIQMETNMFGQEVGFCPNGSIQLPFGYSCFMSFEGQDLLTGTMVADGNGNIVAGSTFVYTHDVNSLQCSSKYNATPDCPYKVPSGIAWNSSTAYVVGDEVDFSVGGKLLTFQAVQNNTNVAPNTSTCTSTVTVPPNCTWDQLYISATGKPNLSGTLAGTYKVQSNGSAVAQLTATYSSGKVTLSLDMVVPPSPLAVGQEVPMVSVPQLGNEFRAVGSAVRVK